MKSVSPSAVYACLGPIDAIRHIVTELVREGASSPLSTKELVQDFSHGSSADFNRIKLHEKRATDYDAKLWLIEYGLSELGEENIEEIIGEDGVYRYKLKKPLEDIRYEGRPVNLIKEPDHDWPGGTNPFSELNGKFTTTMRDKSEREDMTELRALMKEYGWVPELPGIKDEHGIILAGHRRAKVAKELGIEEHWQTIHFGKGKAADARRLRVAIASNIGIRPITPTTRANIAEFLYGEREWDWNKIAEALNVVEPPKVVTRPISGGRGSRPKPDYTHVTREIDNLLIAGKEINRSALAKDFGVGEKALRRIIPERIEKLEGQGLIRKAPDAAAVNAVVDTVKPANGQADTANTAGSTGTPNTPTQPQPPSVQPTPTAPTFDPVAAAKELNRQLDLVDGAKKQWEASLEQWINATFATGFKLLEAKVYYKDNDTAFGEWFRSGGLDNRINNDDRAALIGFARNPIYWRAEFEEKGIKSWQTYWRERDRSIIPEVTLDKKVSEHERRLPM